MDIPRKLVSGSGPIRVSPCDIWTGAALPGRPDRANGLSDDQLTRDSCAAPADNVTCHTAFLITSTNSARFLHNSFSATPLTIAAYPEVIPLRPPVTQVTVTYSEQKLGEAGTRVMIAVTDPLITIILSTACVILTFS
ncbi:hypothetical protein J6590_003510 [Homalodisca vitripennis]|nr:hypothetical protein J6590_003510 [Homalodisca vitripennis]